MPMLGTKGMTLREILSFTPREPDIKNARYVKLLSMKNVCTKDSPILRCTTSTAIPGERPRKHTVVVKPRDNKYLGTITKCPAIMIDCDCERFKFMWEYALYRQGAADINRSDGDPPVQTNPELIPACCKHGFVILRQIQKHGI